MRRIALVSVLLLAAAAPAAVATDSEQVAWLDANVVPLETCEAGHGFADLERMDRMIGCARIVGLGESTHGTREHFQMKHRLVEYLVEEHGFTIFAIEASTPEANRLDAYVLGGEGDPRELIEGMYFWTWNTEEVLAMVEWMRARNATVAAADKIHFTGFDMQTPDVAAGDVVDFVEGIDPARAGELDDRYAKIVEARSGGSFGVVTYRFPVEAARGTTARFACRIRTESVTEGYAGLWWRVDGPGAESLAFDNMHGRGVTGTTDWTEHVIELPVDETAEGVYFGLLLPGKGTAWFDDGSIELVGRDYDDAEFDLGFEGDRINALRHSHDDVYLAELDGRVAYAGKQSLRLASLPRPDETVAAQEALDDARAILAELEAERDFWLAIRPEDEVERTLLNARIVAQCLEQRVTRSGWDRDRFMADNVVWLTERNPDARIVLWAHNYHVSRAAGAMGTHLAERFGELYLPVGFATAGGSYYAMGGGRTKDRIHRLQLPPPDSYEARFAAARAPIFALDLRGLEAGNPGSDWLLEERPFRSVGAMAMEKQFRTTSLSDDYDLVVFVQATTAARQLP